MQNRSNRAIRVLCFLLLFLCATSPELLAQTDEKPNFLIILADDMGYSDVGAYGGEIDTPNIDRLARNGLRYTHFFNAGRCWPTRASILTGYYPNQTGADPIGRGKRILDGNFRDWTKMLPEYFEPMDYRAYHSGKWHVDLASPPHEKGHFDRSYWLTVDNAYFSEEEHFLNGKKLPSIKPGSDHYDTRYIASRAIQFLKEHQQKHENKPWITYLAFTAPHWPLHAPRDAIEKYDGRYDRGWDKIRAKRLERMKEIGIIPDDTPLPPREPNVLNPNWLWSPEAKEVMGEKGNRLTIHDVFGPGEVLPSIAWKNLTPEQKQFQAKKMQIHAAMVDVMDRQIGRVLDQLKAMGDRENTVVMFLSDNGASAEVLDRGEDIHDPSVPLGSAGSFPYLGPGWAMASNTPFRLYKTWMHNGGTATPFILNWPAGLSEEEQGELRHGYTHTNDILPTMLEIVGADPNPSKKAGPPLPGTSFWEPVSDPFERHSFLYFNHVGHKALIRDGWKLVRRRNGPHWELYDLREDPTELNDRSDAHPDRVKEMKKRWKELRKKYLNQYPR